MDILYPTKDRLAANGRELRWSLRSLCKHYPEHGQVILAGSKPDWCTGVRWVYATDDTPHHFINQCSKMLKALPFIKGPFFAMSDDVMFLRAPDFNWRVCNTLEEHVASLQATRPWNDWYRIASENLLHQSRLNGVQALNYSTHTPFMMDTFHAKAVFEISMTYPTGAEPMTLYGNGFSDNNLVYRSDDVKVKSYDQLVERLPLTDRYLSSGAAAENDPRYQAFLQELFPEPCKYEKP